MNKLLSREVDSAKDVLDSLVSYIEDLENKIEYLEKDNIRLNEQVDFLEDEVYELSNRIAF